MLLSTVLSAALLLGAETPDTLQGVTVVADRGVVVSRTDTIKVQSNSSIEDLIYSLPGLGLGDYGGAAGLKSVSLRGLGSAQTAIYIDGVRVGNVQSGQADLGFLDFAGAGTAVVDYAQNSISFNTAKPVFGDSAFNGRLRLGAGSFGTWNPRLGLAYRFSDRMSLSAQLAYDRSKGNFSYGEGQTRTNADLSQLKAGADLFGVLNKGEWHAKAYYNKAERGIPGATTYPSDDRQKDENYFLQGSLRKSFNSLYTLNLSAKAARDDMYYHSSWGDNYYKQSEFQLNSTHRLHLSGILSATLGLSANYDKLSSDSYTASRTSVFSSTGLTLRTSRIKADLILDYDIWADAGQKTRSALSPSFDLRYELGRSLSLVGFARRAYRVPVFNELYYVGFGNPELKPEDAFLSDLGLEWHPAALDGLEYGAKFDLFYNLLKDKIISAPSEEDQNIWYPYNVGKVEALGTDLSLFAGKQGRRWMWRLDAKYSWQNAVDISEGSYNYGLQVPYIARHSAVLSAQAGYRSWKARLNWNLRSGRRDSYGELPSWNSLDLDLRRGFSFGKRCGLEMVLSARDLTDCRYEAVRYYPVPGRSFIAGVEFKF